MMIEEPRRICVKTIKLLMMIVTCLVVVGCAKTPLYDSLEEVEVNEMMAILLSRGIAVEKIAAKDQKWSVSVDTAKMAQAVDLLNSFGYPKDQYQSIGQLFKKSGLVSSPSEERIRFMYGLSQELAETISQIDGVLTARVHIVLPDNDPLKDVKIPSSAALFVKYRRGSGVESLSSQIKRLVANSIEGLDYDKVSLVFVPSELNEMTSLTALTALAAAQPAGNGGSTLIIVIIAVILLLFVGLAAVGYLMLGKKKNITHKTSSSTVNKK